MKRIIPCLLLTTACFAAQDIQFPASFDKLAEKAEEVVNLTLNADMLGFAGKFLSEKSSEEKAAKEIAKELKGIYIRSFEFAEEGDYSDADIEEIRSQLKPPEWIAIVNVRSKKNGGENSQIYIRKHNGKITGLTILAAEPKELTIVHIIGELSAEDFSKLSGKFGIPNVHMGPEADQEN